VWETTWGNSFSGANCVARGVKSASLRPRSLGVEPGPPGGGVEKIADTSRPNEV
jgi:hypothetical protein